LSHIVSGGESLNSGHFEICTIPGSENENCNLNPSTQQEQPNKSLGEYLLTLHESSGAGYPARLTKFSSATLGFKMKNQNSEIEKLRKSARGVLIGSWIVTVLFIVVAAATLQFRGTTQKYWGIEQLEPFKNECLDVLAASPETAEKFVRLCNHLGVVTTTAQELMGWLALLSVAFAIYASGHAFFSWTVLKNTKQDGD
jgi:hypothetical protein